ncbi:Dabb family protein [Amycolatopsis rhabdoformis]|uniref:Dabb family protein n=1 Tax=Amycolatopsis rhabdoformis TaxID=1448059 RepID=A0ABZ1IJP6_9PSEU|nr:Dabb family protein [Amycolatopsis rhabdoformis]WSE34694.1 Dabb family protein [Amycolatopsis rhabdoformis]
MSEIRHVFAWQVAEGHDGAKVIELLTDFSKKVDVIRSFEIGGHTGDPGDNGEPWDGVLITDFATWADLDTYSNHPAHVELVAELKPMVKARAVVDFVRAEQ